MVADFEAHVDEDWAIVFDRNGLLLGYAILLIDDQRVLLDNIAVDASAQRQGIGTALVNRIERHVIEIGRRCYDLYTNVVMTENIRWYEKLGFVETKRLKEKGFRRVYMQKTLGTD
jgi:ribosomal protein S18 acetylase RimI-like enzyme